MDFPQPLVGGDVQSGALGQHLRGLIAPRQIAGVQARGSIGGQHFRCPERLRGANVIERNVGLTLKAIDRRSTRCDRDARG